MERLHVLIADDHPLFREGLHGLLDSVAETEVLGLTLKTVRNHVSNIFSKLQVADRAQAVIRAREAGLGHGKIED